jgi:TonB family protein
MELRDSPSRLRRGAAPADERTSAFFVGIASALHAALLLFFVSWSKPPIDVAMPGGEGAATPRAQLVRLSPLRTYPAPEAESAEPERERPRPALIKKYTPGAPIVPKKDRTTAKKSTNEPKSSGREVTAAPQADRASRWVSADGSRSVGVKTDGDFTWSSYIASIRNKIGSAWTPPPGMSGGLVRATLYFRIGRNGQVSMARIEDASGNTYYDQTAMRALLVATPLPPLPAGYDGDWLGVHFGFEYQQ